MQGPMLGQLLVFVPVLGCSVVQASIAWGNVGCTFGHTSLCGSPRAHTMPERVIRMTPWATTRGQHRHAVRMPVVATGAAERNAQMGRLVRSDGAEQQPPASSTVRTPIYDFEASTASRNDALAKFERIDDVIMGGISKSKLMPAGDVSMAAWQGIVRTDGGGFCGQRTRPFQQPLNLSGYDGLYISCALSSDKDAARRAWKLSLRLDESRGEVVYQAQFIPPVADVAPVYVPFHAFRLVRGPIEIAGAPKISNVSAIFQIGFTCSKFVIDSKMSQLENFRNGSFQLDIAEIGAYSDGGMMNGLDEQAVVAPVALSDAESKKRQPLLLRVLLVPLFGVLFSETRRRRRRAYQLLRLRSPNQLACMKAGWAFKRNLRGQGFMQSLFHVVTEAASSTLAASVTLSARILLFPVLRLARKRREKKTTKQEGTAE